MTRPLVLVLLIATALVGVGACSSSKKARPEQPMEIMRGQKNITIIAKDNLFTPPNIAIDPGTKVTWKNTDTVAHNVKKSSDLIDFGAPFGVDANAFGPGQSYSFTFKNEGHYFYACTIHAGMSGQIQVGTSTAVPVATVPKTSTTKG